MRARLLFAGLRTASAHIHPSMCMCFARVASARSTGHHSTAQTYGHGGSQSSVGFCDPVHKLAVVIVCNTRPGPKHHYERMCNISTAVYEDLGLAPNEGPPA